MKKSPPQQYQKDDDGGLAHKKKIDFDAGLTKPELYKII
jgi:hypothetical protein